ncbi:hypothetical protein D3H65_20395 [Paraflavitalea soli]|uniref:Uncharacterized protein n=1 Tax=Paraflavitalea soli TaxID=2315862 RepID=A0A3B7MNV6_9BACT|nr:hypothetical protein D3H65_20395 [Paraflavitalea soli]
MVGNWCKMVIRVVLQVTEISEDVWDDGAKVKRHDGLCKYLEYFFSRIGTFAYLPDPIIFLLFPNNLSCNL